MVKQAWGVVCVTTMVAGTVAFMSPDEQTALSRPRLGLYIIDIIAESDQTCSLLGLRFSLYGLYGSVL